MKVWAILIIFWMVQIDSFGQSQWKHLSLSAGLPSEEVYKLAQDKKGYVFAFTELGAMKFNGRNFQKASGFPSNASVGYALAKDKKGDLWMYNSKGDLGCYADDTFRISPASKEIRKLTIGRNNLIYNLQFADNGKILVHSFVRKFELDLRTNALHSVESDSATGLVAEKRAGIWMLALPKKFDSTFLFKGKPIEFQILIKNWRGNEQFKIRFQTTLPLDRTFLEENKHGLWIGFSNRLLFIDSQGNVTDNTLNGEVIQMKKMADGRIWLSTFKGGLFCFQKHPGVFEALFPEKTITDYLEDRDGNIWVSSLESGVYTKNRNPVEKLEMASGEIGLVKKAGNQLAVGFGKTDFSVFDGSNWKKISIPPAEGRRFTDVVKNENGYLLSSNSGSYELDSSFRIKKTIINKFIKTGTSLLVLEPFEKGKFWATHTRGVGIFEKGLVERILNLNHRTSHLKWWKNLLWLATDNGLYAYRWEKNGLQLQKILFEGNTIKKLQVNKSKLWVSVYEKGFFTLDTDFQPIPWKGLETLNHIFDFYFLGENEIYLACSQGLLKGHFNENQKEVILEQNLFTGQVFHLEHFHNHLWLGTKEGLYRIAIPVLPSKKSNIILAAFESNGKSEKFQNGQRLPYEHRQLGFHFDVPNCLEENPNLLFKLLGPLNLSGKVKTGEVLFQNLPSGTYSLSVEVADANGLKMPGKKVFQFTVLPAFWETWWFRIVAFLFLVALVLLITTLTVRYYRRKDAEANRLQQLIASYKITALQSQMNPHFVSNALTAIQNLILSERVKEANGYLTKFSRMLRQVLELSSKPIISLEKEMAVVQLNVELEALRFSQKFDFEWINECKTPLEQLFIPTLITQPFVENAIWHGLLPLPKEKKGKLQIHIREMGEKIEIRISDNGVGRKHQTIENEEKKSLSQTLTFSRIESLNQAIGQNKCSIEILDLKNEQGEATGTEVILCFPTTLKTLADESLFTG